MGGTDVTNEVDVVSDEDTLLVVTGTVEVEEIAGAEETTEGVEEVA